MKRDSGKVAQTAPAGAVLAKAEKRAYFRQTDFPQVDLLQAQKIAAAIVENFAAKEASPPDIALAIGISPTSRGWPEIAGSSLAYGLTEGGVNAKTITLTELGRRLTAPEVEGADFGIDDRVFRYY